MTEEPFEALMRYPQEAWWPDERAAIEAEIPKVEAVPEWIEDESGWTWWMQWTFIVVWTAAFIVWIWASSR